MSSTETETVTVVVVHTGRAGRDPYRQTTSEPLWSWRQQALCRDIDSSVFYPSEGERGPARRRREQVAKAICAACPVREPCATYALVNRELHGVWGGLSEADRAAAWRLADDPPDPPILGDPGTRPISRLANLSGHHR